MSIPFLVAALSATTALAPVSAERVHAYQAVALSPAGDRTAAVEEGGRAPSPTAGANPSQSNRGKAADTEAAGRDRPHGAVVVRSARDGRVLASYDPCAACGYGGLAWSPDGRALAFVASDVKAHNAVLEVAAAGGAVRAATTVDGTASTPRWSPDGASLALLATPGARKAAGAVQAGVPLVGEIGVKSDEQRLGVVAASGGALRFVSPADTYVYEYGWTPDGRGFVATSAKGDGDNNWWIAKLVAYDAAGGAERVIAAPKLQMNFPRASADGRSVYFIGGLMSDFGSVGGDLYRVDLAGGEPRDLTPGYKGTITSLATTPTGVAATALVGDRATLLAFDGRGGAPRVGWSAPVSIAAADGRAAFSADGTSVAFSAQDYEHAPRLMAGPFAAPVAITHDNDALPAHVAARSLSWRSDGYDVQGWLLAPLDAAGGGKHPMIVQVHGGPSAAAGPGYVSKGEIRELLDQGYYVLEPNPRGSYGQGEAFTRANVKDFGGGDLRDIERGIDAAAAAAPVDTARVGVTGVSYGGFMTMYAVTHSTRFKAGVAGAGIADWYSYYGQNGIHQWMLPFFGASAYDARDLYLKLSPIDTIKQAKTPTFIWVGERDIECPPAQSIEMFNALKEVGVPTSLVIYAGEGHGVRQPDDVKDVTARTSAWFAKYLAR